MENLLNLLNFSLINIDKPAGPTSYTISEYVRNQLGLKKTSHMGTLDPKVTGVLPITLGRACKLAGYFITHDKDYIGVLHTHKEQDIKKLQELINKNFLGKIKQIPPHRSAVKRAVREREVYSFKLLNVTKGGRDFTFECSVQGGTYIRKLCSDLGDLIGGAHMGDLRRVRAGIFDETKIFELDEFTQAVKKYDEGDWRELKKMIVPAEEAIRKVLKVLEVDKGAIKSLYFGKPLFKSNIIKGANKVKEREAFALFCKNKFIGIYKRTNEEIIFARALFVYN